VVKEEASINLDGQVVAERIVLTELEGFETVDYYGPSSRAIPNHVGMIEDTVSAESGEVELDGAMGSTDGAGDLSVCHAADGHQEDLGE